MVKGITYIGKDPEALRRVYDRFKEEIFKPSALALPSDDELAARMKIGLSGCLDSLDQIDDVHKHGGT